MKRVHRNILIVCAFLLAIVLLLPILVYIPPVQRKAIAYAEQWVCSQTPYCISIEQFTLKFPLRAALHNVVITTAYNDTMLTAGKMQADVALVPLINRKVEVRNISLHDASVDFISPDSTLSVTADIGCIGLENGDIRLIDIIEFEGSELSVTLPPYCAAMVVVSENAEDFPIVAQD